MILSIFGDGNNGTAHWEPTPNSRGTWDILSTCVITLALSVYTALHLNIPSHKAGATERYGLKIKWAMIGLLAPEIVVYNAWFQRADAVWITSQLRKHYDQPGLLPWYWSILQQLHFTGKSIQAEESIDNSWTITHGFYITMGGYTLDMSDDEERVWPIGVDRLTLHPNAVLHLLKQDSCLLPILSKEQIIDKSKANRLAKFIICLQALWFCIQLFSRIQQGLLISLLELSTFTHSVCALLSYVFWWHKPLDVEVPTVIYSKNSAAIRQICALGWALNPPRYHWHVEIRNRQRHWWSKHYKKFSDLTLIDVSRFGLASSRNPFNCGFKALQAIINKEASSRSRTQDLDSDDESREGLIIQSNSRDSRISNESIICIPGGEAVPGTPYFADPEFHSIELDTILHNRLKNIPLDILKETKFDTWTSGMLPGFTDQWWQKEMLKPRRRNLVSTHAREGGVVDAKAAGFQDISYSYNAQKNLMGLCISGLFYGGFHMLPWGNNVLPSDVENVLWKVSTLTIICLPWALMIPFLFSGDLPITFKKTLRGFRSCKSSRTGYVISIIFACLCPLYAACRAFLVVEAFHSVLYLDRRLYKSTEWSVYWPHIS